MGVSSNSILHFTDKKENLKTILTENFRIKYCKEIIAFDDIRNPVCFASPMVSFCDLPISQIKNHITNYGNYGIGLTKEWANRQGLNPVIYIEAGSKFAKSYWNFYENFIYESDQRMKTLEESYWNTYNDPFYDEGSKINPLYTIKCHAIDFMRYMKNYEFDLQRRDKTIKNYRFSDEREWRYVPEISAKFDMILSQDFYNSQKQKDVANKKLEHLVLKFDANDIKYLIIKNESEIFEFIEIIRKSKGTNYSYNDIERLMTRFITIDQIMSDF